MDKASPKRERFALVGPTYPFRGGISHYTTNLCLNLRHRHQVDFYTFTRQYPRILFPGQTDRDPSSLILRVPAMPVIDPLQPGTWHCFWKLLRANRPDVVILQWWTPFWAPFLLTTAYAVKRWVQADLLYICHNVVPHDGNHRLNQAVARCVLRRGDAYLVHSRWEREKLLQLIPGAQVCWSPIPGELFPTHMYEREAARERLGLSGPVLLFFGFIRSYKGISILLQAMAKVAQDLNLHLLVVGEFWVDQNPYRRLVRELQLEDHVTFISHYVPNEEAGLYFAAADAVVLPYLTVSQSAVATLSLHFGRPVIASAVLGLTDVVEDGRTGLLVPPGDSAALGQAIRYYYVDGTGPRLTVQVQARAREGMFQWDRLIRTIEELRLVMRTPNLGPTQQPTDPPLEI